MRYVKRLWQKYIQWCDQMGLTADNRRCCAPHLTEPELTAPKSRLSTKRPSNKVLSTTDTNTDKRNTDKRNKVGDECELTDSTGNIK
ncbi:hypothetical protein ACVBIL_05275 [Shewanella sp. 125m-7]